MPAIDVHFHVLPPAFVDAVQVTTLMVSSKWTTRIDCCAPSPAAGRRDRRAGTAAPAALMDVRDILAEMDRRKLDAAAISPPPQLFAYWAPAGRRRAHRTRGERRARPDASRPSRSFSPAGLTPVAGRRTRRARARACLRELRLCGAALCTHVNGIDLDLARSRSRVFGGTAARRSAFLHPQNAGDVRRLQDYHLWNLVGFMMETATAAARLLMSGTFERFPRLKVVLAHGGGFLPYQFGRLDHGYEVRPELQARLPKPPTALSRQHLLQFSPPQRRLAPVSDRADRSRSCRARLRSSLRHGIEHAGRRGTGARPPARTGRGDPRRQSRTTTEDRVSNSPCLIDIGCWAETCRPS